MELKKLKKDFNIAKCQNKLAEAAELANYIGDQYSNLCDYEEALDYHHEALSIYEKLADSLGSAITNRCLGEVYSNLGRHDRAIAHQRKYLDLAKQLDDNKEVQRAWATFGRAFLLKAQELNDEISDDSNESLKCELNISTQRASYAFRRAMKLAEDLMQNEHLDKLEFYEMYSGLMLNIALIEEICQKPNKSIEWLEKTIKMCREKKELRANLLKCFLNLARIKQQLADDTKIPAPRIKLLSEAKNFYTQAIQVATNLRDRISICESLMAYGELLLMMRDFESAKKTFIRAYKQRSPRREDHEKACRYMKISHLISKNQNLIVQNKLKVPEMIEILEKLGDCFCEINLYNFAVDCYLKQFSYAKKTDCCPDELAKICVSIAETYNDCKNTDKAIEFYEHEIEFLEIIGNKKSILRSIKDLIKYLKENKSDLLNKYISKKEEIEASLQDFTISDDDDDDADAEDSGNVDCTLISNIDTSDITDTSDQDDPENEENAVVKRRLKQKKFTVNELGEYPLHRAVIDNDMKNVIRLIDSKHPVNVTDNAGWTPLHEAANHGHFEIAQYLCKHGANVNYRGDDGITPILDACRNGHLKIIDLLIRHGANVCLVTDQGKTVVDCLREWRFSQDKLDNNKLADVIDMERNLKFEMDRAGFTSIASRPVSVNSKDQPSLRRRVESFDDVVVPIVPDDDIDSGQDDDDCQYQNYQLEQQRKRKKLCY